MDKITVRKVESDDIPELVRLVREFAEYEDLLEHLEVTRERLQKALFTDGAVVEGLVALEGETAIGYAFFFTNFASFRAQRGFYLEDLYVSSSHRGRGVGELMLR